MEQNEQQMIRLRVSGGYLNVMITDDPYYPGIDIEYLADDDNGETLSRPRVIVEEPINGQLRALIWSDVDSEDYTEEIIFEK